MTLSVRNQLVGRIVNVSVGDVMSTVRVQVGQDQITAAMVAGAARTLRPTPNEEAHVLISATDVSLSTEPVERISIRNRLPGTITKVVPGPVIDAVEITLRNGEVITAAVLKEVAEELSLREGQPATALVRSTEVNLSVP